MCAHANCFRLIGDSCRVVPNVSTILLQKIERMLAGLGLGLYIITWTRKLTTGLHNVAQKTL